MRIAALLLSLIVLAGAAEARKSDVTQFEDGEPVAMQADHAYILVRQIVRKENFATEFVFVRALSADELKAVAAEFQKDKDYTPPRNVVEIRARGTYSEAGEERSYVLSVKPGTYILGEQAFGINGTCMCMGSVKFEAKAGVLTDLGYLLAARNDKATTIPELANVVQQKVLDEDLAWMVVALRPATESTPVPEQIKGLPRVLADYHAVNKFPNYFSNYADRLTPVPGILGYDAEGNVLDLRTGGPADSVVPH